MARTRYMTDWFHRYIITRSWFETTALNYKPRILFSKIEEIPCFVHKLSVILTALYNINRSEKWGKSIQAVASIFFTLFFTAVYIVKRLVHITDNLCTKRGESSIVGPKIRSFKSRAGYNGAHTVADCTRRSKFPMHVLLPSVGLPYICRGVINEGGKGSCLT